LPFYDDSRVAGTGFLPNLCVYSGGEAKCEPVVEKFMLKVVDWPGSGYADRVEAQFDYFVFNVVGKIHKVDYTRCNSGRQQTVGTGWQGY
jgi:hypothetical protein